jgi:hypothetical protein
MKRFSLRLPDDLHEALGQIAQQEYRSLHNQILIMLEDYLERYEFRAGERLLEQPLPAVGMGEIESQDVLMILDGDRNQPINLMQLKPQTFAVFGTRNRHFLRVMTWDPESEDSQQEFSALARAGYHIRRWG